MLINEVLELNLKELKQLVNKVWGKYREITMSILDHYNPSRSVRKYKQTQLK